MSNFQCEKCGANIIDGPNGYVTGCEHYPIEKNDKVKELDVKDCPERHLMADGTWHGCYATDDRLDCHCEDMRDCMYRQILQLKNENDALKKGYMYEIDSQTGSVKIVRCSNCEKLKFQCDVFAGLTDVKVAVKLQAEKSLFREALEKILNDDDKPSCVNDSDCPLNGGDGYDNHCDMNCPFIIAKKALEEK